MKSLNKWSIVFVGLLLVLMGLVGEGFAQQDEPLVIGLEDADLTFLGEDIADWAAYFASPAGDVNGDGLYDVLIGAPMAGNKVCPTGEPPPCADPNYLPKGEGVGYLVLGRPQNEWPPSPMNLADADASFLGCEELSMTARQLYTAGDVNGDGYDDILISGWKCFKEDYKGKAYLFLGRPDVEYWGRYFPVEQADASFQGEHGLGEGPPDFYGDMASYYVSTAGDVNADGYDDFLITATKNYEAAPNAGQVYLILGRPAADWGSNYPLAQADASFLGEAEGDRLGRSATGVGDVNGDGYADFLIASISSDYGGIDAGQNYLFLGRATEDDPDYDPSRPWWGTDYSVAGADASFVGEAEGDESGRRVAGAGDVNGDGYSDFLMGAARNSLMGHWAGIAHLILGRQEADWGMHYSLAQADASFVGEQNRDQAGRRLSGAGDANNDGYDDFLIGAPHNNRAGEFSGTAYLIYGRPDVNWGSYYPLSEADVIYTGKPDVGVAGYDVAEIGDFDGDSIDDFLIAAYGGRNNNETTPGEAYLLLGNDAPRPMQFIPDAPEGNVGEWQAFTGDYWEPNGWQDLDSVQLVLGRDEQDPKGLHVIYQPADDALYLRNSGEPGWLGPCSPGEVVKLNNTVVQLDCGKSTVVRGPSGRLRVMWYARWLRRPFGASADLLAYLQAEDLSGHDSGFVEFGTWPLWWHELRVDKTVAPSTWMSAGVPLTYTLTFSNTGGITATNVLITDVVPSELINVSIDSNRPITRTGTVTYTWFVGDLPLAEGGVITITGEIEPDLPPGHTFTNTATISGSPLGSELGRSATSSVMVVLSFRTYVPSVTK